MPKLRVLDEARAAGLSTYTTGKPCRAGHVAARYVSTRACVVCADIKAKRWQAENVDQRRVTENHRRRKRLFGLDVRAYQEKLQEQGGGCAICGGINRSTGRALAVDHDHKCCPSEKSCGGCVRGLLCDNCNHGIGKFRDDPALLLKAVEYLRTWRVITTK